MKIETKFNLDDVVFLLYKGKLIEGTIWDIRTINRKDYYEEFYLIIDKSTGFGLGTTSVEHPEYGDYIDSKDIFYNKKELLYD